MHQSRLLVRHLDHDVAIIIALYDETSRQTIGGCRQLHYACIEHALADAFELSRAMAFKTTAHQLKYSGAKSVIYNPHQIPFSTIAPEFADMLNKLDGQYYASIDIGTGTKELDLLAPLTPFIFGTSVQTDPSIATSAGVFAVIEYLIDKHLKKAPSDTHIAIQGLGKVGMNVALKCLKVGINVTATDLNNQCMQSLTQYPHFTASTPDKIFTTACDIFVPAACGHAIDENNFTELNTRFICPIANNPIDHPERLSEQLKHKGICYIPDFISNGGGVVYVANALDQNQNGFDATQIVKTLDRFMQTPSSASLYNTVMQALNQTA